MFQPSKYITELRLITVIAMKMIEFNPSQAKVSFPGISCKRIFPLKDIQYFKADNNYTFLVTEKEEFLITKTLKSIDNIVRECGFIRCHQSYSVNIDYISIINTGSKKNVILTNKKEIPVSKAGYELLKIRV